MDRASDYGSGGWGFKSLHDRLFRQDYARLKFYSDLNSNVGILSNICVKTDGEMTVSNDSNVINEVVFNKYSKLFHSDNKPVKLIGEGKVLTYTAQMITTALASLSRKKATSWDLIPGRAYEAIVAQPEMLANFINRLLELEKIPEVIALGRLFCLNKNCSEPGDENSIRPLVIMSMIIKIIEHPLNQVLKKVKLNQAQLGFREKLSTELNIIRLRCRLHEAKNENYDRKSKMPKKYILFVDLSEAFDRVVHEILVEKMTAKRVPEEVINVLIKLLISGAISLDMRKVINVKNGLGQGKLCSPLEFDIYIDDLLDATMKLCHTQLGFADDTGYICRNLTELNDTIDGIDLWCRENRIAVNKKKSGILIINDDAKDGDIIRGIPVVTQYNYLGVMIDSSVKPGRHVAKIRDKLKVYLRKNSMLQNKYFSPFSLLLIVEYFVKSRLSYGLSCFLDVKTEMKKLNLVLLEHLKSIFKLPKNTSHKRIQMVLGEPDIHVRLAMRLLKNWHKYQAHFGEFPELMRPVLLTYFSQEELKTAQDYETLKNRMIDQNMQLINQGYTEHQIRKDHRGFLKKFVFNHPDNRDFYLIRFFTNTTQGTNRRLFPVCICGEDSNPRHGLDECQKLLDSATRAKHIERAKRLLIESGRILTGNETLYDLMSITYFSVEIRVKGNQALRDLITLMKEVIFKIVIDHKEKDMDEDADS